MQDEKYHKANQLLNMVFQGMVLASFEFAAGFKLKFEHVTRHEQKKKKNCPEFLTLEPKADMWFGKYNEWQSFIKSLPLLPKIDEKDNPSLAYRFMILIGSMVEKVSVDLHSTLHIKFLDGDDFFVLGHDSVWEESWVVYIPPDAQGTENFSISSNSQKEIHVHAPSFE